MMHKFYKNLSVVLSAILAVSGFSAMHTNAASDYSLGDVNMDGRIGLRDVTYMIGYLNGEYAFPQKNLSLADVNSDGIVDMADVNCLSRVLSGSANIPAIGAANLEVPNNEARTYVKHNCKTGSDDSYTLGALPNCVFEPETVNSKKSILKSPEIPDTENQNCVRLSIGGGTIGSGVVVGKHVVATAAHCVYDKGAINNITVQICNEAGTNVEDSFEAVYTHYPKKYADNSGNAKDDYDYALIYVDEDLTEYGVDVWNLGIPTETAITSKSAKVYASGFCYVNGIYRRYYNDGVLTDDFYNDPNEAHNNPDLRLHSTTNSLGGKSGGAVYYETIDNGKDIKSIVGVLTGGFGTNSTWSTRVTPTLAQFYKNNPNI